LRRRFRPRRQWDDDGVASTVGTIMALLVFLTFLSLITNQYVPVWMKDSEAGHMGEALGQLGVQLVDLRLDLGPGGEQLIDPLLERAECD